MAKKNRFDFICEDAQDTVGFTIRETAQWHYFNRNGVYAAKKASDERISRAVDEGRMKSGAILAYGSMNDFWTEQLLAVVRGKRSSRLQLRSIVQYIFSDIAKAGRALDEAHEIPPGTFRHDAAPSI